MCTNYNYNLRRYFNTIYHCSQVHDTSMVCGGIPEQPVILQCMDPAQHEAKQRMLPRNSSNGRLHLPDTTAHIRAASNMAVPDVSIPLPLPGVPGVILCIPISQPDACIRLYCGEIYKHRTSVQKGEILYNITCH